MKNKPESSVSIERPSIFSDHKHYKKPTNQEKLNNQNSHRGAVTPTQTIGRKSSGGMTQRKDFIQENKRLSVMGKNATANKKAMNVTSTSQLKNINTDSQKVLQTTRQSQKTLHTSRVLPQKTPKTQKSGLNKYTKNKSPKSSAFSFYNPIGGQQQPSRDSSKLIFNNPSEIMTFAQKPLQIMQFDNNIMNESPGNTEQLQL